MSKIQLGDLVRDIVTGYEGVVTCIGEYQFNCDRVGVQRRELVDGKPLDPEWFDVPQLVLVESGAVPAVPLAPPKFNFGDLVEDTITPLRGVVVGRSLWLNGCTRFNVQSPEMKDGKPVDEETYPQDRLVLILPQAPAEPVKKPGGPMKNPGAARNPRR